jgi:Spy/CpxP family protein refolding chaperone
MKKLLVFTVLVAAVTLAGFWGGRKVCMMLMWPGSVNPSQQWYFNLGLTAEQAASLKQLELSFRKDTDPLCIRICKERLELLKLMKSDRVDREAIYQKIEEIGALQTSLEKEIATHILEVKKDLTPEQSEVYIGHIREELYASISRSGYGEVLKQG